MLPTPCECLIICSILMLCLLSFFLKIQQLVVRTRIISPFSSKSVTCACVRAKGWMIVIAVSVLWLAVVKGHSKTCWNHFWGAHCMPRVRVECFGPGENGCLPVWGQHSAQCCDWEAFSENLPSVSGCLFFSVTKIAALTSLSEISLL